MTNIQAIDLLKGLEQSLDDYCELNDEGKTAFRMAITALELFGNSERLPSAQPEPLTDKKGKKMDDIISKQSAIDTIHKIIYGFFDVTEDDSEEPISEKDKLLLAVNKAICNGIKELPSAQPEIIRCKDCKWKQGAECVRFADVRPFADDFCSRAERREE